MAILNTNISIVAHYIIQAIALAIRTSLLMDGGIVEENGHQRTPLCPFAMLICRRLALMLSTGTLKGQQGIHGRHAKIDLVIFKRFLHTYSRVPNKIHSMATLLINYFTSFLQVIKKRMLHKHRLVHHLPTNIIHS